MRASLASALVAVGLGLVSAPAGAADIGCDAFIDKLRAGAGDLGVDFTHALMAMPASARSASQFEAFQAAVLRAALGWEAGKAKSAVRAMAADAREYLKASRERGDVYISGKTEEHEPGGVSLGLIVTDTDTAFILIGAEQE